MTENKLISLLINEINLNAYLMGLKDYVITRNAQPTDQSPRASKDSKYKTSIFINKVSNPLLSYSPYIRDNQLVYLKSARFQIDVMHYLDITNKDSLTANDIAEMISDSLFDIESIERLMNQKIMLQNRGDIIPRYFVNDKDRFESLPCFDINLFYETIKPYKFDATDKVSGSVFRM